MFWSIYCDLCAKKGKSPNAAAKEIGISSGSVTQWKNGRVPQIATLHKIAEYFNVPLETFSEDSAEKKPALEKIEKADKLFLLEQQNIHMIPIFEGVSAGFGVSAIDQIADYIPMYIVNPREADETICIKVRGDSMSPKIEDGDIIQVHKQSSVDGGSIAVVMIDGEEFFVKRVFYGETWIELRSENIFYKPMRFNGKDVMRVRVVGLDKKIIKNV